MASSRAQDTHGRAAAGSAGRQTDSARGDRETGAGARDRAERERANASMSSNRGSGERGTLSQQQDRRNLATSRALGNTAPGVGNYSDAMDDFNNIGQGFLDDPLGYLGRKFGGIFGVGEVSPATQPVGTFKTRNTATWGVDPIAAALGLAGVAGATPLGTGMLYDGALAALGSQGPMISFNGPQPDWSKNPHGVVGGTTPGWGDNGQLAGGGTGNGGQWEQLAQNGPMAPQPGQMTPATPAAALGPMEMGAQNLNVPGPTPYGLMVPGYQWRLR